MDTDSIREEIEIELESMAATLTELEKIQQLASRRSLTEIERTAAGAFLGQLYGGLENVMKRICRHAGIMPPRGPTWHADLLRMFCPPGARGLPLLFDDELAQTLEGYRRFRHLFVHGYGVLLDWPRMKDGVGQASHVFGRVFSAFRRYVESLS